MNKKIKPGSIEEAALNILRGKSTIQEASINQDAEVAYDLVLWIENDPKVYRKLVNIVKNIQKKMKAGKYNHLLAPKLWMGLVDDGVKSYTKEMGITSKEANETFTKKIKLSVSNTLADKYKTEIEAQDGKMFEEVELEENLISQIAKKTGKNAKRISSDLKKHLGFAPSSDPYYWDVLTAESPDDVKKAMKGLSNVRGSQSLKNLQKVVGKMMESEVEESAKVRDSGKELEEASEIEITDLDNKEQQSVKKWSKMFSARADYAFDGIHGKIIGLQGNRMAGNRITKDKLKEFVKGPDFRWVEFNEDGEITIGF